MTGTSPLDLPGGIDGMSAADFSAAVAAIEATLVARLPSQLAIVVVDEGVEIEFPHECDAEGAGIYSHGDDWSCSIACYCEMSRPCDDHPGSVGTLRFPTARGAVDALLAKLAGQVLLGASAKLASGAHLQALGVLLQTIGGTP